MGKIVALPNNGNRHLTVGLQALKQQNYASAVAHLEKAFKLTPAFEVALPLTQAYAGLHQPRAAVPYVSQFMEDFLADEAGTSLLFDILLALPDYRFAWAVLHHVRPAAASALKARIVAAEAADRTANAAAIADIARELRHLGGFEPQKQEQLINTIGRLPRTEMMAAARPNLTDPDVHPAIRISLLDALTAVDDQTPVTVIGYATSGTVTPSALPGVLNDPTLLQVLNQVQLQIGLNDPELMRATVEVLRFELGYLYPFIDQVIPDPKHFATSYLNKTGDAVTPAERDLFTWLANQTAQLMNMAK
ncbi:hypothetical protein [Lacticaseibacillus daqingensis]|uniref:hypothetical protein n=1 Tax=Lacticaseibacillus daqingensis TaxID=2486014 RepID=UPI000F7A54F8|nr:hypothetical protein [Lacticaseibacillus daqingensis]